VRSCFFINAFKAVGVDFVARINKWDRESTVFLRWVDQVAERLVSLTVYRLTDLVNTGHAHSGGSRRPSPAAT